MHRVTFEPVLAIDPEQASTSPAQKVDCIPPTTPIERGGDRSSGIVEMLVPPCVHPLVSGHGQEHDLVELANRQGYHPKRMESCVASNEHHPWAAFGQVTQRIDDAISRPVQSCARLLVELVTAVDD